MKCTAKICPPHGAVPSMPCNGDMEEKGNILSIVESIVEQTTVGGTTTSLKRLRECAKKLYQCKSCKDIKIL